MFIKMGIDFEREAITQGLFIWLFNNLLYWFAYIGFSICTDFTFAKNVVSKLHFSY